MLPDFLGAKTSSAGNSELVGGLDASNSVISLSDCRETPKFEFFSRPQFFLSRIDFFSAHCAETIVIFFQTKNPLNLTRKALQFQEKARDEILTQNQSSLWAEIVFHN